MSACMDHAFSLCIKFVINTSNYSFGLMFNQAEYSSKSILKSEEAFSELIN